MFIFLYLSKYLKEVVFDMFFFIIRLQASTYRNEFMAFHVNSIKSIVIQYDIIGPSTIFTV